MFMLAFTSFATGIRIASAHDDHPVKSDEITPEVKIVMMEEIVKLLTEVKGLLEKKVAMQAGNLHGHDESNTHALKTLSISVMVHDDQTHVHVHEHDKEEVTFFLENIALDDTEAIITAIAEETGIREADVEAALTIEHDDHDAMSEAEEVHDSHAGMEGLDGIHIMADGTVMLGTGAVVSDATINDDNMIVLGDGSVVEPAADMR